MKKSPPHAKRCKCRTCTRGHFCHVPGCRRQCPPEHLMCREHWREVPPAIRKEVTVHYWEGQERGLRRPSRKWLAAAKKAIATVRDYDHIPGAAKQGALFVLLLAFVTVAAACATARARNACRPQCQEHRGPALTWYGGPTVPPDAWDTCMQECETREEGRRDGR